MSFVSGCWPVLRSEKMARGIYRLAFRAPAMAAAILPGQFLMLRLPGRTDPLLGRAFALYDVLQEEDRVVGVEVVYQVVGKMTGMMAQLRGGDLVEAFGPLGRPFPSYSGTDHLVCVAGGIGQTPFLSLLKRVLGLVGYGGAPPRREVSRASFCYGARGEPWFAGLDEFGRTGAGVHLATDDGSAGHHGFVTELAESLHQGGSVRWVGCGPEPMLKELSRVAQTLGVPLDLSLETPMACGAGICYSCVTKVRTADGWDYRRVCMEGPVFPAEHLFLD